MEHQQEMAYGLWNQMVTLSMTSCDLERSRAWPQYVWKPLSRKWLDIQTRLVKMVTTEYL